MRGVAQRLSACLAAGALALSLELAAARPAFGLELPSDAGRYTSTLSRREQLKRWDTAKSYGAARVRDQDRSSLAPIGVRMGNFILFPSVGFRTVYDDNPDTGGGEGDFRFEVSPSLEIRSDLPRHMIDFLVGGNLVRFGEQTEQNHNDGYAATKWRIDVDHAHALYGDARIAREHEERGDPENPLAAEGPVAVDEMSSSIAIKRDAGRLAVAVGVNARSHDYHDVRSRAGDMIDQDFRDTDVVSGEAQLLYRFSPGYTLRSTLQAGRTYNRGNSAIDRDSMSYGALIGLDMEFSPLVKMSFLGGYTYRDYDSLELDDFASLKFDARAEWLATTRLTARLSAGRAVSETGFEDAVARQDTHVALEVDYDIRHDLVATARAGYRQHDFQGTSRSDHVSSFGLGLQYFYTKNMIFTMGYDRIERQSSVPEFDFTSNRFSVGANFRF